MASFTDQIPQFNPYVQQLPVDAMVQVGTHKQAKYEEGITKIQAEIERVAGMDVARDVDRAYLQSKVNQLGNNLRPFMASDFSEFQLVNSVSGMTSAIADDPNVQTAVGSTSRYRKEQSLMEEDRKKGTLTPDNELFFNKQANKWFQSPELGEAFSGKYIPHFDVFKHTKEYIDAMKPGGYSYDQIYQMGADGNPLKDRSGNLILSPHMTRLEKEGLFPEAVKVAISQAFSDPRVSQQLQISGQYNYRNYTPEQLIANKLEPLRREEIAKYQETIEDLKIKNAVGKKDPAVDDYISKLEIHLSQVNEMYDGMARQAMDNPESIASFIYTNETKDSYSKMFTWEKTKQQIMTNPAWQAQFDMQKEANEQSRFAQRLRFDMQKEETDLSKWQLDYQQKERLAQLAAQAKADKKLGQPGTLGANGGIADYQKPLDVIQVNNNDIETARTQYEASSNELVWNLLYETGDSNVTKTNAELLKSEMKTFIDGKPITKEQAISNVLERAARAKGLSKEEYIVGATQRAVTRWNSLTPEKQQESQITNDKILSFVTASDKWKRETATQARINEMSGSEFKAFDNIPYTPKVVKDLNGNSHTLSKQDMIDLALYGKYLDLNFIEKGMGSEETKAIMSESVGAKKRLEQRGKAGLLESFEKTFLPDKKRRDKLTMSQPKRPGEDSYGVSKELSSFYYVKDNLSDVYKFYDALESNYGEVLSKKAEAIKAIKGVNPNLLFPVVSGNAEDDRATLSKIKNIAGMYSSAEQNVSPTFNQFKNLLDQVDKVDGMTVSAGVTTNELGAATPSLVIFKDNERFEMALTNEEFNQFGYDLNEIYERPELREIKTLIKANGGKTSVSSNYKSAETYTSGDYLYGNSFFPGLASSKNHSAKVNIVESQGKFYPIVYMSNGINPPVIKEMAGDANLENVLLSLKQIVTPTFIDIVIK
jgi:hypothetical protein